PCRSVLQRLPWHAAGAGLGGALGLPLPRPALPLAGPAPVLAGARSRAARLRALPREPRPGRALGARRAAAPADLAGAVARADRAAAARPADADALPGAGVRRLDAVPLLRRPRAGAHREGARRPARVPRPV